MAQLHPTLDGCIDCCLDFDYKTLFRLAIKGAALEIKEDVSDYGSNDILVIEKTLKAAKYGEVLYTQLREIERLQSEDDYELTVLITC